MLDSYLYVIIALLPLAAIKLVSQVNPYHALVVRGILGAIAALVYAVLGAADVALTEALVGTMLAITLYAVAVRSSLVMRLGVIEQEPLGDEHAVSHHASDRPENRSFEQLMADFRKLLSDHYMRLELVPFPDLQTLQEALQEREIHALCVRRSLTDDLPEPSNQALYLTTTRIQRLYTILQTELSSRNTVLTYTKVPVVQESPIPVSDLEEVHL